MSSKSNVIIAEGEWKKPFPNIDHDNAEFWAGLGQHKLMIWKCHTCGASYWPKCYCRNHENQPFAANMSWVEASGKGRLFAINIHHTAFNPGFKDEIPYTYALVELEEGPLISAQLIGEQMPRDIYDIDHQVEVVYEDHPQQGFTIPKFRIVK